MWNLLRLIQKIVRARDLLFYIKKIRDLFFYQSANVSPPIRLQIEPVSYCILKCEFCVLSQIKREHKLMPFDGIKKIINESGAKWIQLSGIGETFIHPDIIKIMRYIKSQGKILKITSNGILMGEDICRGIVDAGVDYIDISIDTTNKELYRKIRGVEMDKVLQNARYLYDYRNTKKSKLIISAKHVYNDENIKDLPQDVENLVNMTFDEVFFSWIMDVYEGSSSSSLKKEYLPIIRNAINKARNLNRLDMVKSLKLLIENYYLYTTEINDKVCYDPVYAPYVTVDGDLTVCCKSGMWILQDKKNLEAHKMGNVLEEHFMDVWNSKTAIGLRKNVLDNRKNFGMCRSCVYDQPKLFKSIYNIASKYIYRVDN